MSDAHSCAPTFWDQALFDDTGDVWGFGEAVWSLYPTTPGAFQTHIAGQNDAFILHLDAGLSTMQASTLVGGSGYDRPFDATFDSEGNVVVTGRTTSQNFPTTPGAADFHPTGAFVLRITPDLTGNPPCRHDGDVSENGMLSVSDAQQAFLLALGLQESVPWQYCAADCNGDGVLSMADVRRIFWAALNSGTCSQTLPAAARTPEAAGTVRTPEAPGPNRR